MDNLDLLLTSWLRSLRAERKSEATVRTYRNGVEAFLKWASGQDRSPELTRAQVRAFLDDLQSAGAAPATAKARYQALRRFSTWLAAEGEIDSDDLLTLKAPKVDVPVVDPLSDAELAALLKTCATKSLVDLRDLALLRVMFETGARAGEVAALKLDDVDLDAKGGMGQVTIRRGKGGQGRRVPIGPEAVGALDKYIRARRTHRLANTDALWLGGKGGTFGYDGLYRSLGLRAKRAGIEGFHPHRLRHTAAHRWLAAGGSETGLLAVAGWKRPDMLLRYTRAQAEDRAAAEAQSLNLGAL